MGLQQQYDDDGDDGRDSSDNSYWHFSSTLTIQKIIHTAPNIWGSNFELARHKRV
jgi:hypothetical protein